MLNNFSAFEKIALRLLQSKYQWNSSLKVKFVSCLTGKELYKIGYVKYRQNCSLGEKVCNLCGTSLLC